MHGFRGPITEAEQSAPRASYATPDADQRKLGRKLRQLDTIFAKAKLTGDDLNLFTAITGLAVRGDDVPPDGPSLREMFKGGTCIRTRIAVD